MKKSISIITLAIFAFLLTNTMQAQLITASDFMAKKKADKSLVIIDANKADNYAKAHVQGAVSIPHTTLYKEGDIEGLIKSPEDLAKIFGDQGVSNGAPIVVLDDGSNKYSSRVYWILKYLGASDVSILHKDMDAFKKARVPLTRAKTTVKATTFTPNVNNDIIADMAFVKNGGAMVIDCRDKEEFDGTSDKSEGHIKGAIHVNYKEVVTEDGAFKSKDEIQAVATKYGITKDKTVVFYCVTSVRAAVSYVAFKEILGYPNVKVYDGAYNEWVAAGNPIE